MLSTICYRFKMADKVDLAKGADSFRLCNPPPFLAALNYASLEVSGSSPIHWECHYLLRCDRASWAVCSLHAV